MQNSRMAISLGTVGSLPLAKNALHSTTSIYYPADSISLVYFIPRQDILSLHGDQGMSQNISVATQSSSRAVS